jgi:CheY-like chemotaxis protein
MTTTATGPVPVDSTRPPKVLCVDDEPQVLTGLRRVLGASFEVEVAEGGADGLARLETAGPFQVVISDMRMPGMTGASFLRHVRDRVPETIRVLLTGYAELDSAIAAVNDANVFRFLLKPCPPETLLATMSDALDQHRLVQAERELLERTLNGSVEALLATLSLADPDAFAQATRVRRAVADIAGELGRPDRWSIEVAAGLSQLGIVSIPSDVLSRSRAGQPLSTDEQAMVDNLPNIADEVLASIPRLEPVRETIKAYAWLVNRGRDPRPEPVAVERAELLHIAFRYDTLRVRGMSAADALTAVRSDGTRPSPAVEALARVIERRATVVTKDIRAHQLEPGMVIDADVFALNDVLLVGEGHEVTASLIARIDNYAGRIGVREPIRVQVRTDST